MEGDKRADSYSSPFDALFGPKGSPPSSTSAVLADIFPPKEVSGGDASRFDVGCMKQGSASETLSAKPGSSVGSFKTKECECKGFCIWKENVSPFINNEQKPHPSYLSSSIFYGGQEHYPTPRISKSSDQFKKDGAEDAGETSKNWWKGGVYY